MSKTQPFEEIWPGDPIPFEGERVPKNVRAFLIDGVRHRIFPGAVCGVIEGDRWLWRAWVGWSVLGRASRPMCWDTVFDLASLTKPLVTAAVAVWGHVQGLWDLQAPLVQVWSIFRESHRSRWGVSIQASLDHRAGYPPWRPLYLLTSSWRRRWTWLARQPLESDRPAQYSCLDYQWLTLGWRLAGLDLEQWTVQRMQAAPPQAVFQFRPDRRRRFRIAATEWGRNYEYQMVQGFLKTLPPATASRMLQRLRRHARWFPQRFVWGEVHDLNAFTLGGVAGNAGAFANAEGVRVMASAWWDWQKALVSIKPEPSAWQWGWRVGWPGWSTPTTWWSHTGFTGTMVAMDRRKGRLYIFLTHRVHPTVRPIVMNEVRRQWLALAVET